MYRMDSFDKIQQRRQRFAQQPIQASRTSSNLPLGQSSNNDDDLFLSKRLERLKRFARIPLFHPSVFRKQRKDNCFPDKKETPRRT